MSFKKKGKHWTEEARDVSIYRDKDDHFNVKIEGGAENAQFIYLGNMKQEKIHYKGTGKLNADDVVLEVNGKRVSGLIRKDVIALTKRSTDPLRLRVTTLGSSLTKDLALYLATRFPKGSIDHEMQQIIRDNLYIRTIPCTTRPPRAKERNGVDYIFISVEEFLAMERSNNLLESGLYGGHYYGTPKPPANPPSPQLSRKGEGEEKFDQSTAGGGKRERVLGGRRLSRSSIGSTEPRSAPDLPALGPLPSNWEVAYTEDNEKYFFDHTTQTAHWLDPRIAALQRAGKLQPADCIQLY
jgi:hypothetical protein